VARNTGGKSNFSKEIKSAQSAKPKEGSAAEEKSESGAFEKREVAQMKQGASPKAAHVAAQGNPQNTNHLQGGQAHPGAQQLQQAAPMQPHMSGAGPMENDPIIHASSIAHAILRHGSPGAPQHGSTMHSVSQPQGDVQPSGGTNLHGMGAA
jgi:hypothetical protein